MRILILSIYYDPEPIPKAGQLAREWQRRGHDVQVVTAFPHYPTGTLYPGHPLALWRREVQDGVPILRTFVFPYHGRSIYLRILNYVTWMFSSMLAVWLTPPCDVMYVWHPPLTVGVTAWVIGHLKRIPYVYDVQDLWPESGVASGLLRPGPLVRFLYRLADWVYARPTRILVVSRQAAAELERRGVDPAKVRVAPHIPDSAVTAAPTGRDLRSELHLDDRFVVMFAGNLGLVQGLETVIDAATVCRDDPRILFALVGDGADRSRLEALVQSRGLPNVLFPGRYPATAMPDVLAAADVVLLQVRDSLIADHAIPTKLLAYLANGKPIIAAMRGACAEMVRDSGGGIVVEPGSGEALAGAVRTLAALPSEERRRLGDRGRTYFEREFQTARLMDVYEDVLVDARDAGRGARSRTAPVPDVDRPVRVLRMIARLNVGGPARHVTTLSDGLRAYGYDTTLVYGSPDPTEGSLEDLVTSRGLHATKIPELGRHIRPWDDVNAFFKVVRLMFRERPDIVHTHTAKAGALGRLAAFTYNLTQPRDRRCLVVHTFHGHVFSGYFGPAGSRAVRGVERALAAITDQVLTISASQKDDICRRYRIAPERKTRVIELGVELEELVALGSDPTLRDELGIACDDVVFSYVGRFVPIKDLPTLVRAFAIVAGRSGRVRLVLVGDGELRPGLERLASDLGLGDRIHFTGWRRDLSAVYGATDVGVLSSINEGTPVALIETMAAGRAVVSTAVGGVTDVVEHERTGLVVPPGNPDALADAMERLAREPALRARLGAAARSEIANRFDATRLAADLGRFYRQALAEKRRRAARLA